MREKTPSSGLPSASFRELVLKLSGKCTPQFLRIENFKRLCGFMVLYVGMGINSVLQKHHNLQRSADSSQIHTECFAEVVFHALKEVHGCF